MKIETPYYLIDERKLLGNLKKIQWLKEKSGAKSLLALKCFAGWGVFDLMRQYMDGTTSSSLFEARLGHETFGKEVHAYSVAYSGSEVRELVKFSDKIIFNSIPQLRAFYPIAKKIPIGLRVNPGFSYSHFHLADPARDCSKLGATDWREIKNAADKISGVMFHYNCENDDFKNFSILLDKLTNKFSWLLRRLQWVSLGGGFYFTKEGYPLEKFADKLKAFGDKFRIQVYLEPGETAITQSTCFVTKVLDIVHNRADIAVVDSSTEAHMLDLLIYGQSAKLEPNRGPHQYVIAGKSCLAGDIFGTFRFKSKLRPGSVIRFSDAGGYSMVKKNWFNGLQMPAIVIKRLNGRYEIVRKFSYNDFKKNLS